MTDAPEFRRFSLRLPRQPHSFQPFYCGWDVCFRLSRKSSGSEIANSGTVFGTACKQPAAHRLTMDAQLAGDALLRETVPVQRDNLFVAFDSALVLLHLSLLRGGG